MTERDAAEAALGSLAGFGWLLMAAPVVVLIGVSMTAGETLTFPPDGLSLRWFEAALGSPVLMHALAVSIWLALFTTFLSLLFGVPAALSLMPLSPSRRNLVAQILSVPMLLPGTVIGFAIYVLYSYSRIGLRGSTLGLALGHLLVATPWVVSTVFASARRIDPSLAEVGRSLGGSRWYVFRRVTLASLLPGIVAGGIFAFVVSFSQFDVSLFLGSADMAPLPIALFSSLLNKSEPTIAAAGILAIVVVVAALGLINRVFSVSVLFGGGSAPDSR